MGNLALAVINCLGYDKSNNVDKVRKHVITLSVGQTERELHNDSIQIPKIIIQHLNSKLPTI